MQQTGQMDLSFWGSEHWLRNTVPRFGYHSGPLPCVCVLWASSLTCLCLSFFLLENGVMIIPTHRVVVRISEVQTCEVLKPVSYVVSTQWMFVVCMSLSSVLSEVCPGLPAMDKIYAHESPERHTIAHSDCAKATETLLFSRFWVVWFYFFVFAADGWMWPTQVHRASWLKSVQKAPLQAHTESILGCSPFGPASLFLGI